MSSNWRTAYSAEALARRAATRALPENRAVAAARSRAWYAANKERASVTREEYHEANKEKLRGSAKEYYETNKYKEAARRKWKRAMDPAYAEKVRNWKRGHLPTPTRPCPELCEACGRTSRRGSLCLDHCHITGKFRGWLCDQCNRSAGMLGDTADGVRLLLVYLEKHS